MALSPREFIEEVNKTFNIIDKRRTSSGSTKLGNISISDILEEVFEISAALQRLYVLQKNIDTLSEQETSNILKKAKFIALIGVCEFFKLYDNKSEYSFWEKYSQESGFTVNDNFIYKILEQSLIDLKILSSKTRENILSIVSLHTNISESYIEDTLVIFETYIKYYYPSIGVNEYINDLKLENNSIFFSSLPEEIKENLLDAYKRLHKIENKVIDIISELLSFINFCNFSPKILDANNIDLLIDAYTKYYNNDIHNILLNKNIKDLFISYIKGISVNKLKLILNELKKENNEFSIILPNLKTEKIENLINSDDILFGNYKFLDYDVIVLPSPYFDIDFLSNLEDNIINIFANKVILKSNNPFDINIGNLESNNIPSEIFKDNKSYGFIWIEDRPFIKDISILSEDFDKETIEPTEKIIADMTLKLFEDEYTPSFKLLFSNLILISPENKSEKIDVFNIDNYQTNELSIDNIGVGFLGETLYDINNKKPTILEFHFLHNGEPLNMKYFEPKISYILDESIVFNTHNKKVLDPSEKIEDKIERLYLFTTKNYENKWFNDVCEITSYTPFGKYNVYEIIWIDRTKNLEINIDRKHKWKFIEKEQLHFEVTTNRLSSDLIKFKDNQISSIDDIKIIISENEAIKDLDVKISLNYNKIASFVKMGYINNKIGKEKNSNIIDYQFFLELLDTYNPGRYDLEFYLKDNRVFNYTFFILPKFEMIEEKNIHLEWDDLIITLASDYPCFRNNRTSQGYKFDKKAKCNFEIRQNNIIHSRKLPYFKKVRIYDPFTEFDIIYEPEIMGFRFMKDNKFFIADKLEFYDIEKKSVVLKNPLKEARLKVNNQVVKPIHSTSHGLIVENLLSIKNYLNKIENEIVFTTNKADISFQVIYYPKVSQLYTNNNIYSNNQLNFIISYQGPQNSLIKISLDNDIEIKKVLCDDDLSPRFIKYDKEANSFNIICDGKEWKDRKFTLILENPSKNINLKAIYEHNNLEFGNIFYLNEEFYSDIKYLNEQITNNENISELYFQRGVLLFEEGLNNMALLDFNKAIEIGVSDLEIKNYIDSLLENLSKKQLYYDILHISELSKELCEEELLLDI